MSPLTYLGKRNWKASRKGSSFQKPLRHSWYMGRDTSININKSLEKVDSNSHDWLWKVWDFREKVISDVVEITIGSRVWLYEWISIISWQNFDGWGVVSYGWVKKMVSWSGSYSWWRCVKTWNCNEKFTILYKPCWTNISNVWGDWLKFCKDFYYG